MAFPKKWHRPFENLLTSPAGPGSRVANAIKSNCRRLMSYPQRFVINGGIARLSAKFVATARRDGLSVALARTARKLRKTISRYSLLSRLINPFDGCSYYTPRPTTDSYAAWNRLNGGNSLRRQLLAAASHPSGDEPRFSVVVPVYNPPVDVLRTMIASVSAQDYSSWELILVDDASPDEAHAPGNA